MDFLWTDRHGQEFLFDPEEGRDSQGDTVAHHRVLAWAWGKIDDLYERKEVDHCQFEVPWVNCEWNLDPCPMDVHGRRTREREYARKRVAADGGRQ